MDKNHLQLILKNSIKLLLSILKKNLSLSITTLKSTSKLNSKKSKNSQKMSSQNNPFLNNNSVKNNNLSTLSIKLNKMIKESNKLPQITAKILIKHKEIFKEELEPCTKLLTI